MDDMIRMFVSARDTGERLTEKQAVAWRSDDKGIEDGLVNVYDADGYPRRNTGGQDSVGVLNILKRPGCKTTNRFANACP